MNYRHMTVIMDRLRTLVKISIDVFCLYSLVLYNVHTQVFYFWKEDLNITELPAAAHYTTEKSLYSHWQQ